MTEAPNLSLVPRPGDVLAEKYTIEAVVGQGAMGIVYRARHRVTGKTVAIKVLQPHAIRSDGVAHRFLREARASARIAHRNIVDTYDTGEWNGLPYLILEFLVGESLDEYLRRSGPLSVEETMSILGPVCAAVHAAHRAGVIHRDLKPENIFLNMDADGTSFVPKVLDFGVSKILETDRPNLTATGHAVGTALYMPLEQMFGARDVTAASDVYALGVIMYECLTGQYPYDAASIPELAVKMSTSAPIPIDQRRSDLPPELVAAITGALEKDVTRRIADVPALARALAPFGLQLGDPFESRIRSRPSFGTPAILRKTDELEETLASGSGAFAPVPAESTVSAIRRSPEVPPEVPARRFGVKHALALGASAVAIGIAAAVYFPPQRTGRAEPAATVPPTAAAPAAPVAASPQMRVSRLAVTVPDRPGASVIIDGTSRGSLDRAGAVTLSLDPGEHFIEIASGNVVVASRTLTVATGELATVHFDSTIVEGSAAPSADSTLEHDERSASRSSRTRGAAASGSTSSSTESSSASMTTPMREVRIQGDFASDPYN